MTADDLRLDVLVVDDQPAVANVIRRGLERDGHSVDHALTGEVGLEMATSHAYDVLVLDVVLPGISGFQVARSLRERGISTPILMLTQMDTERDVIQGLEHGADAYLPKPFRIGELRAHLLALKRRVGMDGNTVLRFGDLELHRVRRGASRGGRDLALTNIEFKILETLMLKPGRVFEKGELLSRVWGLDGEADTGVVHVHVTNLRGKLEAGGGTRIVRTVRGVGYRLAEPD